MPDPTEAQLSSVIESAMSRLAASGSEPPAPAAGERPRTSLGRRDYDQALRQRLEQLQTALGDNAPLAPPPAAAGTAATGRRFAPATLAATALFSALGGAAATWLALGPSAPLAPPAQPTRLIMAAAAAPAAAPATAPAAPTAAAAAVPSDEQQVRARLESWRAAWSQRDSDAYLSHYAPDFTPADGQTRAAWAAGRQRNLASRSDIAVGIRELRLEPRGEGRVQLQFLQDYAAGSYRERGQPKTLLLVRQDGNWLIAGEWQGTSPAILPAR